MEIIKSSKKRLEIKVVRIITKKIYDLLKSQKFVVIGIPGGESVKGVFEIFKKERIPWKKIHIFMVDERLVPISNPKSNFGMAKKIFIDYLTENYKIPKKNIHPFNYFNLSEEEALNAYKNELREYGHRFDIVLLGLGEDGHIASLFPNHPSIKNNSDYFIISKNSPNLPRNRISSSRKLIKKSQLCILLVFDKKKRDAFNKLLDTKLSINNCPAKIINEIKEGFVFTNLS